MACLMDMKLFAARLLLDAEVLVGVVALQLEDAILADNKTARSSDSSVLCPTSLAAYAILAGNSSSSCRRLLSG